MRRMNGVAIAAGISALGAAAALSAAPKGGSAGPAPIATYWMDVTTTSGFGAGMSEGQRPNMAQIMGMMNGGGGSVSHTLDLRLASKTPPAGAGQASHFVPATLQMGPSLPLVTPVRSQAPREETGLPANFQRPRGRMLIYWGCGDHVSAGQPTVIDFSKLAAGQVPPAMKAFSASAHVVSGPSSAPGFGRWPNDRDSRAVPASGSIVGAHRVSGNYAPDISFSLSQDFMPGLGLAEAGASAGGGTRLRWTPAASATGYALAMFGSNAAGDVIMWSSARNASMPAMDYVAPAEVKRLVAAGAVLPASASECVLPAEVGAASPMGMVTMIAYGPEVNMTDGTKAPKWATKVRFKSTASVMHGMHGMMGEGAGQAQPQPGQPQPPRKKKRGFGIGDILQNAIPIPH